MVVSRSIARAKELNLLPLTVSGQQGDKCMHWAVIQVKVNVLFSIYEFEDVDYKTEYGGIPPKSSKTAI